MKSTFVVFLVVVVASSAYGKAFRHKRQSDNNEDGLDDRYGFENRRPWQNQNQLPWQNQNGGGQSSWQNQNQNGGAQFPWQNQNGGRPWQNQNQNQGQSPWQNQNQNGGQGQFPWQNQNQNQLPTTASTTQAPNGNGGSSNAECLRNCPVTPEYNPVCGTDNVTYTNPGRLGCAQACGVSVSLLRSSPCPTSTPAPSS
ncbi:uncharacterized protein LOC128671817 isoform X1 [Plodia interpunctella]|uniref:uncharacterized protein LOC128671817 isoform X1 n=1 Tax=Plodia interpunctella TaxID=58824 RepID=UPI002367E772|nr:uncharacterized protein LOC128671817 isoform X1 [Plodia interpunctella]